MTGASLKYLIKEGFRNTWTNRMMSIASICVLMSCLVLIGSASMMFLNIDSLLGKIEEENVIMVYISKGTTDEEIANMENEIKACGNIKQVEFVSKEDAWAEQLSTMEDAQAEFFTQISSDIPLPDAYKVTVENLDQFNDTVSKLKQLQHISLFIISNTIKLTVYSRRLEISIMKSVGATNSFVRLPFVVEGMILGIVSGIISLGLVWGLYELAVNEFSDLLSTFNGLDFLKFQNYALPMLGIFIAIGVVTGVGGSLITMSKYLNKEGSEISGI